MLIDARQVPDGTTLEADVCIVGGGAAGITLGLELARSALRVLILESGGLGFDERTQSLYEGPSLGLTGDALDVARLRFLGGSTNHWAGNCMRLDPIDFEARPEIPHSGWPIGRADLDPFYERAQKIVETPGPEPYDTEPRRAEIGLPTLPFDPSRLRSFLYAESPPTNFGIRYEDDLVAAPNVAVYLHANALELDTDETASRVTGVAVACIDGPRFRVEAKRYVVAAGGIETARLLLLSNRAAPAGLGNTHDLVGRFFMDHISLRPALTTLLEAGDTGLELYSRSHAVEGGTLRGAVAASEELIRAEGLGNFIFFVFVAPNRSPGAGSAVHLRRRLGRGEVPDDLGWHIGNMLTDLDGVTNRAWRVLSGSETDLIRRDWLDPWIAVESVPNPESRVRLIDERDPIFGQPRCALDWRLAEADLRTARRATEILGLELGRLGFGRVWSRILHDASELPPPVYHGKHHCGTTRMSDDPKSGVVDRDCRVHGLSNLYIASSSVFPTHGAGTPTLTIVALAIRLADQIRADAMRGAL